MTFTFILNISQTCWHCARATKLTPLHVVISRKVSLKLLPAQKSNRSLLWYFKQKPKSFLCHPNNQITGRDPGALVKTYKSFGSLYSLVLSGDLFILLLKLLFRNTIGSLKMRGRKELEKEWCSKAVKISDPLVISTCQFAHSARYNFFF